MNDRKKYNGNGKDLDADDQNRIISFPSLAERDRIRLAQQKQQAAGQAREPMFNLPPATKLLVLALVAIHIVNAVLISNVWQYWVQIHFGFIPARYTGGAPFDWSAFAGPFTYAFLHGGGLHLVLNTLMLTALGAGLERWMGGRKMFALFMLCSLFSALVHFAFNHTSVMPVVGASGGISGLFAAALMMLRSRGAFPTGRYGLWPLVAVWIVISLVFGLMGGPDGSAVAWAAHIGGFLAGFLLLKPVLKSRI